MATASAFVPTPEQLHELNEVPQGLYELTLPAAIHLREHGLEAKAQAREHCGNFGVLEACKEGHVHQIVITCHQKYCPFCGPRRSIEALERWYAAHPYLRERKNFLYFDLWRDYPVLPTREEVDKFVADVQAGADIADEGRVAGTGAVVNIVAHILVNSTGDNAGFRLRAKFLWWGDFKPGSIHLWPTLRSSQHVMPASSFHHILERLMDQEIPIDPADQAQFEFLFNNFRNLRCFGGFVRAKDDAPTSAILPEVSEELFPMEGIQEITPTKTPPRKCKKCGSPIVRRSQRCRVNISNDERAVLTWYDLPQEE